MTKEQRRTSGGTSLRPADFVEGGGGIDGAEVTIESIGFVDDFNYGGHIKGRNVALYAKYNAGFAKPWETHYNVGKAEFWEVVADGDGVLPRNGGKGINQKSVVAAFINSVVTAAAAANLDLDDLLPELSGGGHSIRPLEGKRVRLKNITIETQSGDQSKPIQVIAEFLEDTSTRSTRRSNNNDIEEKAAAAILEFVTDAKRVKKDDLALMFNEDYKKDADLKAMVRLSLKDRFLSTIEGVVYNEKRGLLTLAD